MYAFIWRVVTLHSLGFVSSTWRCLFGNTWTCERRAMAVVKKHEHVAHIKKEKKICISWWFLHHLSFMDNSKLPIKPPMQISSTTYGLGIEKYTYPYISLKTGWCKQESYAYWMGNWNLQSILLLTNKWIGSGFAINVPGINITKKYHTIGWEENIA